MDPVVYAMYLYFLIVCDPNSDKRNVRHYRAIGTLLSIVEGFECEDKIEQMLTSNGGKPWTL